MGNVQEAAIENIMDKKSKQNRVLRVTFIGKDRYGTNALQGLLKMHQDHLIILEAIVTTKHENSCIINNLCRLHQIPLIHFTDMLTLQKDLETFHLEIGVVAEFDKKIPSPIINLFEYGIFNFHPSKLPSLRGGGPLQGIILGHQELSITCHLINSCFDSGPIVNQGSFGVYSNIDAETLYRIACSRLTDFVIQTVTLISKRKFTIVPQNEENATYFNYKDLQKRCTIDWISDGAAEVCSKVWASLPDANYQLQTESVSLKQISECYYSLCTHQLTPGTLLLHVNNCYTIATHDGAIVVKSSSSNFKKNEN